MRTSKAKMDQQKEQLKANKEKLKLAKERFRKFKSSNPGHELSAQAREMDNTQMLPGVQADKAPDIESGVSALSRPC